MSLYSKDLFYMDTYINVKFYCDDKDKANLIMAGIDLIYRDYHELTDRYNSYDDLYNVNYINNNHSEAREIVLDSRLYDLISYAYEFGRNNNFLFDINMGGVIDVWKKYRDSKDGIPSISELKRSNKRHDIILLGDNKIKNNHPNIDLGGVSKGYATQVVSDYLRDNGIKYFLINAGGNVSCGDAYMKDFYKIGIQSPDDNGIVGVVRGNNISVVTSGGYERNYEYDGKIYHHIIDPNTLFPADYMKSVTVVCSDSGLADMLSTTLFLMPISDGLEFLKSYDAEAIFVDNDNNIIKSDGFVKYE
jgi:thiamine biosynthesis lipoprotein